MKPEIYNQLNCRFFDSSSHHGSISPGIMTGVETVKEPSLG